jgi:ABC-type xylose transport system permease subunit
MASTETQAPKNRRFGLTSLVSAVNELTIVVGFVAISLFLAVTTPTFLTSANILSILLASSLIGIVAVGETFVIVTGGIDLSVGSVVAFTGVMAGLALNAHLPVPVAVLIGIGIGALSGGFIAFAVTVLNMSPFIVSLAVLAMARGLAFIVTNGNTIFSFPDAFDNIGGGNIGPLPVAAPVSPAFPSRARSLASTSSAAPWLVSAASSWPDGWIARSRSRRQAWNSTRLRPWSSAARLSSAARAAFLARCWAC